MKQRNFCEQRKKTFKIRDKQFFKILRITAFDVSELKREENIVESSTIKPNKTTLDFEDEIQNLFHTRNKRSSLIDCPQEVAKPENEKLMRLEIIGPEENEFVINELSHYSTYAISIRVCRQKDNRTDEHLIYDGLCSEDTEIVGRTLKNDTADIIQDFEVFVVPSNTSENHVKIAWVPPKNPNGKVLNYEVKLERVYDPKATPEIICISLLNRENACSQIVDKIKPGNYSIQILAVTLAGTGNFSDSKYLLIESISHLSLITSPPFMALLFLIIASVIATFAFMIYKRNQPPEVVSRFENFDYENHPMNG